MSSSDKVEECIKVGLKTIAASFPVAASFSQAWNEYESRIQYERIKNFFELFNKELESIKERVQRAEDYIKRSGEVPSQIEMTVDKIRKESSGRKRSVFAHLLANLVTTAETLHHDDKLTFIDALDTLTDQDLQVLQVFEPNRQVRVKEIVKKDLMNEISYDYRLPKLAVSLSKLESRGLIVQTVGPGDQSVMGRIYDEFGWKEKFELKYFELLPHGVMFCKMVFGRGI